MKNLPLMWNLFQDSKLWNQRPSTMVAIEDEYASFCFDQVVSAWGTYVTNQLDQIEGKNDKEINRKRHRKLSQLLGLPMEYQSLRVAKGKVPIKK